MILIHSNHSPNLQPISPPLVTYHFPTPLKVAEVCIAQTQKKCLLSENELKNEIKNFQVKLDEETRVNTEIESYLLTHTTVGSRLSIPVHVVVIVLDVLIIYSIIKYIINQNQKTIIKYNHKLLNWYYIIIIIIYTRIKYRMIIKGQYN